MCGGISGLRGIEPAERAMQFPNPSPFQADWANDVTYTRGDVVRVFTDAVWKGYRCLDRTSTPPTSDPGSHWQELSYNDAPVFIWRAFDFDATHPDEAPGAQVTRIECSADPSGGSGSYDLHFFGTQTGESIGVVTINAGDDNAAKTTAIQGLMSTDLHVDEISLAVYDLTFTGEWAGAHIDVVIENADAFLDSGSALITVTPSVTVEAVTSQLPAPLGSIAIGQGFSLTDGYAYIKVGRGDNQWVEIPTEHPTDFVGTAVDGGGFTVVQGDGGITQAGSYGWQQATLGNTGGPTSAYIAWGIITFGSETAGEAGQPVTIDFAGFLAQFDTATYGAGFRGGTGLPIGHAVVKIGGETAVEPYHVVMASGSFGGTVVTLVDPAGGVLGVEDAPLQEADQIEFTINCFLTTD